MSRLPTLRGYRRGIVFGFLAAALGYAATFAFTAGDLQKATSKSGFYYFSDWGPAAWKTAGWLYAGAHHVTVTSSYGNTYDQILGRVPTQGAPFWGPELFAVPVLALVTAGALAAADTTAPRSAARRGASVVLGYGSFAVLGLFAFQATSGGEGKFGYVSHTVGLEPVQTLVVMGIVFPVVFGALGGLLRYKLHRARSGTESTVPG